jgi:hypothetical protein
VAQEFDEPVQIPRQQVSVSEKNQKVMMYKDMTEEQRQEQMRDIEVRFVDRVVFKEKPVVNLMERSIQTDSPVSLDQATQTNRGTFFEEVKQEPWRMNNNSSERHHLSRDEVKTLKELSKGRIIEDIEGLLQNTIFSAK